MFLGYGYVWLGFIDVLCEGWYVYLLIGVKLWYLNWYRMELVGGKGENCVVLVMI